MRIFSPASSTYQKHLKLGQCLKVDGRRSLSKFGDVTWPSLHFIDRHFTDWLVEFESLKYQYEIFYLISDVNIDNCTQFC